MHYSLTDLPWEENASGFVHARITLRAGDTAVDPSSTKRKIRGPARVRYTRWADGGVTVGLERITLHPVEEFVDELAEDEG